MNLTRISLHHLNFELTMNPVFMFSWSTLLRAYLMSQSFYNFRLSWAATNIQVTITSASSKTQLLGQNERVNIRMVINDKMFSFLLHLRKLSLPRWPGTTNAELLMLHTIVAVEDQTLRKHSENARNFLFQEKFKGKSCGPAQLIKQIIMSLKFSEIFLSLDGGPESVSQPNHVEEL